MCELITLLDLTRGVHRTEVPRSSLLGGLEGQYWRCDCFSMRLPIAHKSYKPDVTVDTLAKAFFTSNLFKIERRILSLLRDYQVKDDEILGRAAFSIDDKLLAWRVTDRAENELLMTWHDTIGFGATWFSVEYEREGHLIVSIGSGLPPGALPKGTVASLALSWAVLKLHTVYSHLLLRSTVARLANIRT